MYANLNEVNTMSKLFEYAVILFLAGLLVILFRWSEREQYSFQVGEGGTGYLTDNSNGDVWFVARDQRIFVLDREFDVLVTTKRDIRKMRMKNE